MKTGYLANGLFSLGDRLVNEHIAKHVRQALPDVDLYVPQENGAINDKSAYADSEQIAAADMDALKKSDFLIAVLDGVEIDSGVAAEIGAFSMLERPIFALFTDTRQQAFNVIKAVACGYSLSKRCVVSTNSSSTGVRHTTSSIDCPFTAARTPFKRCFSLYEGD